MNGSANRRILEREGFDPLAILDRLIGEEMSKYDLNLKEHLTRNLYHYTTLDGLRGILGTEQGEEVCIRATNYQYLNDWAEPNYIYGLIREALINDQCISQIQDKEFLKHLVNFYEHAKPVFDQYVACFCGTKDLLSQWRGYGGSGVGYCIEFELDERVKKGETFAMSTRDVAFRRIIYSKNEQYEVVANILRVAEVVWKELCDRILDKSSVNFSKYAHKICSRVFHSLENTTCFKHSGFKEEEEVRLIVPEHNSGEVGQIHFINKQEVLVPYYNIHLNITNPTHFGVYRLSGVQIGPGLNKSLAEPSLSHWLRKNGYLNVEFTQSSVPFSTNFAHRPGTQF